MEKRDPRIDDFSLLCEVEWNQDTNPTRLPRLIKEYGPGPFRVIALQWLGGDTGHPVGVTVEDVAGSRYIMNGAWFKKK